MPPHRPSKRSRTTTTPTINDARFSSAHSDPRFQNVPNRQSKVKVDARFNRMLTDTTFSSSSAAPVDKRGKKNIHKVNPMLHYYLEQDKDENDDKQKLLKKMEEKVSSDEEESGGEEEDSRESQEDLDSSTDEDEDDDDDDEVSVNSDICHLLMASHEDTPLVEQETYRLAIVNMDWDHIKAVDLYVVVNSCLPKGGQILSVGIYPSEFGLKCMEVEAVRGPSGLLNMNEDTSGDDSAEDNENLRTYELNKLRYYFAVVVCDSSATANYIYETLNGTELLSTSNVLDLRFIPDSMEFKHPPRDMTTEAPVSYKEPDFHTRALQHSTVKLTWEEDEPERTKVLRRKFKPDQVDDDIMKAYIASESDESDNNDEKGGESDSDEEEDGETLPNSKGKKHTKKEKLRALLLSQDGSGSDHDGDKDMEITFNPNLEDLNKRILEKKDKKSETVWEQHLRKKSEKKKARKNQSKDSSDDDSSDFDVQAAAEQADDFFMEEESLEPEHQVSKKKNKGSANSKGSKSGKKGKEQSPDIDKEREASKAELELLFAEDQQGKDQGPKGYNLKPKKVKGKKGKEIAAVDKIPIVNIADDSRFSAVLNSPDFAVDPTDPQYKRSAAYARLQKEKLRKAMETEEKEAVKPSEQNEKPSNNLAPVDKEKIELSSVVRSLKRNLGNVKNHKDK